MQIIKSLSVDLTKGLFCFFIMANMHALKASGELTLYAEDAKNAADGNILELLNEAVEANNVQDVQVLMSNASDSVLRNLCGFDPAIAIVLKRACVLNRVEIVQSIWLALKARQSSDCSRISYFVPVDACVENPSDKCIEFFLEQNAICWKHRADAICWASIKKNNRLKGVLARGDPELQRLAESVESRLRYIIEFADHLFFHDQPLAELEKDLSAQARARLFVFVLQKGKEDPKPRILNALFLPGIDEFEMHRCLIENRPKNVESIEIINNYCGGTDLVYKQTITIKIVYDKFRAAQWIRLHSTGRWE